GTSVGTTQTYPSYPTMTPPVSTPAAAGGQTPVAGGAQAPAAGTGQGMPTVFESGGMPARPPAPAPHHNLTLSVGDFDGDGRNEIRVDVPQARLNEDLRINVKAKVGNEEVSGTFDIDV